MVEPHGRAALLTAALRHHQEHGDGDCPVCQRPGALTRHWRQATEHEAATLNQQAKAAEKAERKATDAKQHAAALLQQPPPVLAEGTRARRRPGPGPGGLAALGESAARGQPGHGRRPARPRRSPRPRARTERLAPLARQARSIWAMLRQESNVDLGAIRLSGSSTQRRVELDVSVDGAPGSALGVMSQGEVSVPGILLPRSFRDGMANQLPIDVGPRGSPA